MMERTRIFEALRGTRGRKPVDLDGDLLAREGQVDPPRAERVAEHPAGDARFS